MSNIVISLILFFSQYFLNSPQQEPHKIKIQVISYQEDDMTGNRLIFKIKEFFRSSKRFDLIDDDSAVMLIVFRTMPTYAENPNTSTTYSVIWAFRTEKESWPLYLGSNLGQCGAQKINEVAENLVADTDNVATELIRHLLKNQNSPNY